jgi:hypothetical protein
MDTTDVSVENTLLFVVAALLAALVSTGLHRLLGRPEASTPVWVGVGLAGLVVGFGAVYGAIAYRGYSDA